MSWRAEVMAHVVALLPSRDQPKGFRPKPKEGVLKSTILAESRKEPKGNRKSRKKPKEGISAEITFFRPK